jgi:NDP-sugar pyrophosphorylase family protein
LLGTAGGVRNALPALGDEPFVVLYGGVITDEPLPAPAELHRQAGAVATLAMGESAETERKGTVVVDDAGIVHGFAETATPAGLENALINGCADPA